MSTVKFGGSVFVIFLTEEIMKYTYLDLAYTKKEKETFLSM